MCDLEKPFVLRDFPHENLGEYELYLLCKIVARLNFNREQYLASKDDYYYRNMVALIPASYRGGRLCPK